MATVLPRKFMGTRNGCGEKGILPSPPAVPRQPAAIGDDPGEVEPEIRFGEAAAILRFGDAEGRL